MNLAIRGIDAQIAHGDTFHNDRHPDLKADYVLDGTAMVMRVQHPGSFYPVVADPLYSR